VPFNPPLEPTASIMLNETFLLLQLSGIALCLNARIC